MKYWYTLSIQKIYGLESNLMVHGTGGRVIRVDWVLVSQQFCSCSFLLLFLGSKDAHKTRICKNMEPSSSSATAPAPCKLLAPTWLQSRSSDALPGKKFLQSKKGLCWPMSCFCGSPARDRGWWSCEPSSSSTGRCWTLLLALCCMSSSTPLPA